MSIIEKLLAYQSEDAKLFEIEKKLNDSPSRHQGIQAQRFLRTVSDTLASIETKAVELNGLYENAVKELSQIKEDNAEFTLIAEKATDEKEIAFLKDSAQKLTKSLDELRKKITRLEQEMNDAVRNYTKLKKETLAYQKQYEEAGKEYSSLKESVAEDRKKVEAELKKLAVGIPEDIMKKYAEKRKDKTFPIIYKMESDDKHCPACGTELSLIQIDKLAKNNEIIECENCRKLLFK